MKNYVKQLENIRKVIAFYPFGYIKDNLLRISFKNKSLPTAFLRIFLPKYMAESNFTYLQKEFPLLFNLGQSAEYNLYTDFPVCIFKLRAFGEKLTEVLFDIHGISFPYENTFHNRLKNLEFEGVLPDQVKDLLFMIKNKGNIAVHDNKGSQEDAKQLLFSAFKIAKWFYETYSTTNPDLKDLKYSLPENLDARHALHVLEKDFKQLEEKFNKLLEDRKEVALPVEIAKEIKQRSVKAASKIEMSETETRARIDQQLRDAGWECDTETINFKKCKTLPEKGRSKAIAEWKCENLWADYALFNGMQLIGIVEAKKHIKNVMSDLGQAKIYCQVVNSDFEITFPEHPNKENYRVPFMFSTNGRSYLEQIKTASGIWFWDGRKQTNIARPLRNWFSPVDLIEKLLYDETNGEAKLSKTPFEYLSDPDGLNLREYQIDAIKAVENKILTDLEDRRALLAMATGTGKTRTMIGMCYRLIQSGRFRRILFLVDRRMLGDQASDSFKEVKIEGLQTFAQIYDLQELDKAAAELDTKIHFATVQSMVKRVAYSDNPPSIGDYDCIVVDEAHRGYTLDKEMEEEELILRDQKDFQSKYRMVLDYFDAYRIGLTATPAIHTAEIFGDPIYTYSYRKAVVEGYLIDFEPPYVFQTKLGKEGIIWEKGDVVKVYDPEENEIVVSGVTEDEIKVDIAGFNRKVINDSFNRNILSKLITDYGIHPEDRKKTLIFAATNIHADMIVNILQEEFEALGEAVDAEAIVKITGDVYNRVDLLRKFKNDQYPSIVVTVDLLTTGIDVPSISNLIFLRRVNSRILYDQMIGRATRRCDEIGKDVFKIYDCVGVSEIMSKEDVMKPIAPSVTKSFVDLTEEIAIIEDEYLKEVKLDRIIAKLQRKTLSFNADQMEQFVTITGELNAKEFGRKLKSIEPNKLIKTIAEYEHLWSFLDREKGRAFTFATLYSEHQDKVEDVSRAYEKNLKPKDYLESFTDFIKQNKNDIAALKIVCTKPSNLTRKDLKELRLILDEKGFNNVMLNTAYKEVSNQEIVADIIAHIRTSALGTALISHQERISNAITRLKNNHDWNQIQLKWIDKIGSQLLSETVITLDDLNKPPFSIDGGLKRLDKIFKNETSEIIEELNTYLYA